MRGHIGWAKTTMKKTGDVLTGIRYRFVDGQNIIKLKRVALRRFSGLDRFPIDYFSSTRA